MKLIYAKDHKTSNNCIVFGPSSPHPHTNLLLLCNFHEYYNVCLKQSNKQTNKETNKQDKSWGELMKNANPTYRLAYSYHPPGIRLHNQKSVTLWFDSTSGSALSGPLVVSWVQFGIGKRLLLFLLLQKGGNNLHLSYILVWISSRNTLGTCGFTLELGFYLRP